MRRIDFCKNSKISNFIIIAFALMILTSCGDGGGDGSSSLSSGSSLVTITVGDGGQTASLKIQKNTLLAWAIRHINDLVRPNAAIAAIPAEVATIAFTISASDIETIRKDVPVLGQTSITETFTVPNGSNRFFLVEAKDAGGVLYYSGSTYADLNGGTVTLNIIMAAILPVGSMVGGVTVTAASSSQIDISWTPATYPGYITSYVIYRNGASLGYTTTNSTFSDTGLSPATNYCYSVSSYFSQVTASGPYSPLSVPVCTTTLTSPVVSVQLSALTASPTTLAAGQNSIITATVTDDAGNPVSGQTVTFSLSVNGSGAILVTTAAATDAQGIATATYTSGAASPTTSVEDIVQASLTNGSTCSVSITRSGLSASVTMVLIPAGSFQMGDAIDGVSSAMPVHTVTVSAFYLDKYEVTKALWDEVYAWATAHGYTLDSAGWGTAATAVQGVPWYDVVKWLNARSEKEGRTPVYYTDSGQATVYLTGQVDVAAGAVKWTANGYRLPTEAEWEYAARGGTTTRYYTGNCISSDTQANYNGTTAYYGCPTGQSRGATTVVGSFGPNPWGLYDMAGNVWEWTWDWYGGYSSSAATNPKGPDSDLGRVIRGGGWYGNAFMLRSVERGYRSPSDGDFGMGVRCALSQP